MRDENFGLEKGEAKTPFDRLVYGWQNDIKNVF
jgi:hypothetical protein